MQRSTLALLVLCGLLLPGLGASAGEPPPNIVVILADDLGIGDLGVYGQERITTPELDAMAEQGARFTQFYSGAPLCPPARNSLLTGLHTGHTHIREDGPLTADGPILPQLLRAAGYRTGMFGKWGLARLDANDVPVVADPAALGWDVFAGQLTHRDAHVHYLDNPLAPPGTPEHPYYPDVRRFLFQIEGGQTVPLFLPPDRYVHDELFERALAFVRESQNRPFFLYLPVTLPHAELVVPEDSLEAYLDGAGRSVFPETPWRPRLDGAGFDRHNVHPRASYAGMVSRLSRDVGRLLALLEGLGLAERTLVLFTSDNGAHDAGGIGSPAFFDSTGGLSGMKWSLREGGIRSPFLAWWPGRIPAGLEIAEPAGLWDLLPTITAAAGIPIPSGVDGTSLLPWLGGSKLALDRALYWETFSPRADYRQAVRRGRYKALRRVDGRVELYDVASDPGESRNLAGRARYCRVLRELKGLMNTSRVPPPGDAARRYRIEPLPLTCP